MSPRPGREPETARRSLRSVILTNLAILAAAAVVLALWTARVVQHTGTTDAGAISLLVLLLVLDVLVFVALGNYLIDRLVLTPLTHTTAVAESIAAGELDQRARPGATREMDSLARSLNRLTDQLLNDQRLLAENVKSLNETNELLHEAQRELVQTEKMASLGRISAGIAHEIGNPLGSLVGYLEVARRHEPTPEILAAMRRETSRIDHIVRDLLDYARPASRSHEAVDVNESIRRVVELLGDQGKLEGIEVEMELRESLPPIEASRHRVDQMFVNLLSNAAGAMAGEGRLSLITRLEEYREERPEPRRRASDPPGIDYSHLRRARHESSRTSRRLRSGPVVRVIVADTGPGIDAEQIDAIFEPFFTTARPGEGTGLGLAIVAGTMDELGGRIEASSAEGAGATFNLYLPIGEFPE